MHGHIRRISSVMWLLTLNSHEGEHIKKAGSDGRQ